MLNFKEWLLAQENLWGNIPVRGRKPSDGWRGKGGGGAMPPGGAAMPAAPASGPKMMKKMKK